MISEDIDFSNVDFSLEAVQEKVKGWANQLVDLSGRNNLITFRETKTTTIIPTDEAAKKLINGESLLISDILPLDKEGNEKAARTVIKTSIDNYEQFGIEALRLISGFATWKTQKVTTPKAPVVTYLLSIENPGAPFRKLKVKLNSLEPEVNTALLLHLRKRHDIYFEEEAFEVAEEEGEEEVKNLLLEKCPKKLEMTIDSGFAIKNLKYQKLPMVNDLLKSSEVCTKNNLISALAGREESKNELRDQGIDVPQNDPDYVQPENEYLVLDSDSSQQRAINAALKGQNLVIEGPPGTGKSQTIVNLIASYIANGKSVLFVAEKRAAIDAVKKRIEKVGLSDCFLDLHSAERIKRRPTEPFVKELEELSTIPKIDCSENETDLIFSRKALVSRTKAITEEKMPWNCSYLKIIEYAVGSNNFTGDPFSITRIESTGLRPSGFQEIKRILTELPLLSANELLSPNFPLSSAITLGGFKSTKDVENVLTYLDNLLPLIETIGKWVERQEEQSKKYFQSIEDIRSILSKVKEIKNNQIVDLESTESITEEGLKETKENIGKNFITKLFSRNKSYKDSLDQIKKSLLPDVNSEDGSIKAAISIIEKYRYLNSINIDFQIIRNSEELLKTVDNIIKNLSLISPYLNRRYGTRSNLIQIRETLRILKTSRQSISYAFKTSQSIISLESLGLTRDSLLDQIINDLVDNISAEDVYKKIVNAWAQKAEESVRISDSSISMAKRELLDKTVEDFRRSDSIHIESTGKRIRRIIAERAHRARQSYPDQLEIIKREMSKRRRRKSARKLFAEAPELVTALKPCWAMSPLVVSQLLPADKAFFDVVIFDEASQIVPSEAVSSILRGKQIVVAGDSKQLSPTSSSFFSANVDEEEFGEQELNEDEFDAIDETESLLDAVKTVLSGKATKTLQWHYRSEDERLIAFSNSHQDLYGSRLITAPSTTEEPPFIYHQIDGPFSEISGKSPKAEIKRTIELCIDHLKNKPHQSLAVVAFGATHARSLQSEFFKQVGEEPAFALFPPGRPEEKFAIRHLETIQGDERDVIFLATGYGPTTQDKLRNDFGPINRDKNFFGLRRLNVAITRARKRIEVISTVNPYKYDDNKINSVGQKALIQYLRYVQSGGKDLGDLAQEKIPMNPFEQDIYDALVKNGVGVVSQYGVSGYRLDFAIQHPEEKGRFIMALEADGASYHSSETARDRDRIRQSHLERLGWKFHRIWSTEWFFNKEKELELALNAIKNATIAGEVVKAEENIQKSKPSIVSTNRESPKPYLAEYPTIDDYKVEELSSYIRWICSDGLLHSDDQIFEEVFEALPYSKRGARIKRKIMGVIKSLRDKNQI